MNCLNSIDGTGCYICKAACKNAKATVCDNIQFLTTTRIVPVPSTNASAVVYTIGTRM